MLLVDPALGADSFSILHRTNTSNWSRPTGHTKMGFVGRKLVNNLSVYQQYLSGHLTKFWLYIDYCHYSWWDNGQEQLPGVFLVSLQWVSLQQGRVVHYCSKPTSWWCQKPTDCISEHREACHVKQAMQHWLGMSSAGEKGLELCPGREVVTRQMISGVLPTLSQVWNSRLMFVFWLLIHSKGAHFLSSLFLLYSVLVLIVFTDSTLLLHSWDPSLSRYAKLVILLTAFLMLPFVHDVIKLFFQVVLISSKSAQDVQCNCTNLLSLVSGMVNLLQTFQCLQVP